MSKRDIGQEILEGIHEVKAYKAGTKSLRVHSLKEPAPPQVIRCILDGINKLLMPAPLSSSTTSRNSVLLTA